MTNDIMVNELSVRVAQEDAFRFKITFDKGFTPIVADEPPPLGKDAGPNAARLLASAIGNCLAASLVFCLSRKGVHVAQGIEAEVDMPIVRTPDRHLRVGHVKVTLRLPPGIAPDALVACRGSFEEFCTVTASVRRGIDVDVTLELGDETPQVTD